MEPVFSVSVPLRQLHNWKLCLICNKPSKMDLSKATQSGFDRFKECFDIRTKHNDLSYGNLFLRINTMDDQETILWHKKIYASFTSRENINKLEKRSAGKVSKQSDVQQVYQPCILQTKKRYVGFMYESAEQESPVYEAKGIETVRRDGCPAGVKLLQQSLCEIFSSSDMSRVKARVTQCLQRLMAGSLPIHELFFTREYHGASGYRPGAAAPPKEIANRMCRLDARSGPRSGERVSWLVAAGPPSATLVSLARTPLELLRHERPPLLGYYVTRVLLPPLQRCLSLLGADVFKWWTDLGYSREANQRAVHGGIARYMWRDRCLVCNAKGTRALCPNCAKGHKSLALVAVRLNEAQTSLKNCDMICESCCGHSQFRSCENTECPVLWRRQTSKQKLNQLRDVITNLPTQFARETLEF